MKRFLIPYTLLLFIVTFGTAAVAQDVDPESTEDTFSLDLVADTLTAPVTLTEPGDESGRRFIVDQTGQIWILSPGDSLLAEPFLDIQDRVVELNEEYDERGLLGLAFHPEFSENGRFFVYYSAPLRAEAPTDWNHTSHVSEFAVSEEDSNQADPNSEQILLQVDQPQSNHNGGTLTFGPDSLLYISLGDGGGANDTGVGHVEDWYAENPGGNGQNVTENLLGSILRIDIDEGDPYGIPTENPYAGDAEGLDEIYAYGFRNPYRISFDEESDTLYAADAGQELWEEVSLVERGGNYGWNVREGTHCFDAENPADPQIEDCPETDPENDPLIDPVIEFRNASAPDSGLGLVVVGGHVYRGDTLDATEINGQYVFGTWSRGYETEAEEEHLGGAVFAAEPNGEDTLWTFRQLQFETDTADTARGNLDQFVLGFGKDRGGELYVLTTENEGPTGETGKVYRLSPGREATAREPAAELPERITLYPNYPNPFNPSTTIAFELHQPEDVTLTVYDVLGREVNTLISETLRAGRHSVQWNGRNEADNRVSSGVYLYRLEAGSVTETQSMILVK